MIKKRIVELSLLSILYGFNSAQYQPAPPPAPEVPVQEVKSDIPDWRDLDKDERVWTLRGLEKDDMRIGNRRLNSLRNDILLTRERCSPYFDIIKEEYESNGIPFGVALAQIQTESVCDENARSSAGALGLTQVMPRTAKYTLNIDPNDLQNPETSIQAGSRYTGMMIDKLNGKLWLGVIAHNSGDRPVKRWIGRVEKPKDQVEYE
ncbi:lytic transglycosylase domain-containing protein, partial [Candidatus Woesearchaeota archaeon]|nr:lytic transglycosylase domain-containing protein [Candidatus Woesearchaeota archaeon]